MSGASSEVLYRKVADRMQSAIEVGTYVPGDRVPSLRELSRTFSVSLNTAREAYSLLESRGVLQARPQAGFYVAPPVSLPRHPKMTRPKPKVVGVSDMVHEAMNDASNPQIVSLAVAATDHALLPMADLERSMVRSIRYRPEQSTRYQFGDDTRELRNHIAKRMLGAGVQAHPDDIAISAGCLEAVSLALLATCRPGDTIAVESPVYFVFYRLVERMRLRVVEIPTDPTTGMQLDVLEYVLDQHPVKAILCIPNFSNPTGSLMPTAAKQRLVALAQRAQVALIEDDIYSELHFSERRPSALLSYDSDGTVIHCSSISKTIAPGLRIGWVSGGRWHSDIVRLKAVSSVCAAAPSVQAVSEFFGTGRYDRHLRRLRHKFQDNMARLVCLALESFPQGTRLTRPTGGMTLWAELPEQIDTIALYRRAREENISLAVGPMFTLSRDFHHFLRLSAGRVGPREERAVRRVADIMNQQAARTR